MVEVKTIGSTKRFGTRYGRTNKLKYGVLETEQRKKYKCPSCNNITVKRISVGIWQCKKCGHKFASKAYTVPHKIVTKVEEVEQEPEVIEEETKEKEEEFEKELPKQKF